MRKKTSASATSSLAFIQALILMLAHVPSGLAIDTNARAAFVQSNDMQEADRINKEAIQLYRVGRYDDALPLFQRSLAIREKALGAEHPLVAQSLSNLGELYRKAGDYRNAEPLLTRSIAIYEKAFGPDHPEVATSLNNLGLLYQNKGEYVKAEPVFQRALAIAQKAFGPDHPYVGNTLSGLAGLYSATGDYQKAEPLFQRALTIIEKARGPQSPDLATPLNNLAAVLFKKGDYAKAEPLYLRAMAIDEKTLGPEHPYVASSINNLAQLYHARGDYAKAEAYYLRARAVFEKLFGAAHPHVTATINNLAVLYTMKQDYLKAEGLFQRALAIRENALGPHHPLVAQSLNNLADLYQLQGGLLKAEVFYHRALSIREKVFGADHPVVAETIQSLGAVYQKRGEYQKAEEFYLRALASTEKVWGLQHPESVRSLNNLSALYQARGDISRAIEVRSRANEIEERNLAINLSGPERERLLYVATLVETTYQTVSLHTQSAPKNVAAIRMALATVLRRKGLSLDVAADPIASMRRRLGEKDRELLNQLMALRSRLATLMLGGTTGAGLSEYRSEAARLYREIEEIESAISSRSTQLGAMLQPATLEAVQALIPAGAALIEFVLYRPYDVKKNEWRPARYAAYILRNQGDPDWVDIGDVETVDQTVALARNDMRDPGCDVKQFARKLDAMVMQPVRAKLGSTRAVLLSPDGALNLVPFAALIDEQGKYLVESFSFTYLASGRDLVRLQSRTESKQSPIVIADPEFGSKVSSGSEMNSRASQKPARAVDLADVDFPPLPGTAEEAEALKKILTGAAVLTKEQATEAALKRVSGPQVLHVATHGFFLDDILTNPAQLGSRSLVVKKTSIEEAAPPLISNPLLRSGLAMAGANRHKSGDDDGMLTAYEASNLDLRGTKLVVLSACDTGVGAVQNGEGVYGLRRSLVIAGAESQVISLWSVNDEATRDLMTEYYKGLMAGRGRAESLRLVQLGMLKRAGRQHPYYWAPFIQSGEWANLQGRR